MRNVAIRLAPEYPFPAAVHDSFETILWAMSEGQKLLNLDLSKAAIGGASAGANLAAVMTQKVASRPQLAEAITFKTQLLVVPVTDNTATVDTNATYKEHEHTPVYQRRRCCGTEVTTYHRSICGSVRRRHRYCFHVNDLTSCRLQ